MFTFGELVRRQIQHETEPNPNREVYLVRYLGGQGRISVR